MLSEPLFFLSDRQIKTMILRLCSDWVNDIASSVGCVHSLSGVRVYGIAPFGWRSKFNACWRFVLKSNELAARALQRLSL